MGIIVMPFTIGALSNNFDRIPKIWHIFWILFRKSLHNSIFYTTFAQIFS